MELQLIEKENKTRIKISQKEWRTDRVLWLMINQFMKLGGIKFEKESSRYKYFLADGDLLNGDRKKKEV